MGWLRNCDHGVGISFTLPLLRFLAAALHGLLYPRLLERSEKAT